ncbi:MAG: HNH endonuclease [Dysgonamonadaceae bacterium]|nr:HNH endonuclease [Dysgonamonadaceae bacterium]
MPVHIRFLSRKIVGRSCKEVTRLFNERFGLSATPGAIKTLLTRHGLRNNHGRGVPREKKYLPHHIQFLKGIVKGRSYAEITRMFNKKFRFAITVDAMRCLLERYNLKNGRDCRFQPGQEPPNKGRKGVCAPGSEKGWFKPGSKPFNTMPLWSERINADGYVEIKYAEKSGPPKNRWKGKHVLIWEKANGPVPKGHVVIFADGNRQNFKLENLILVSRKELAVLNHLNMLSSKNEDITKISVGIARLRVLIADRKRGTLKTRGNKKLVIIDNRGSRIIIACDQKTDRYFPARETKFGLRRLRASLKPRKTIEEARDDLIAYALKRGWQRA